MKKLLAILLTVCFMLGVFAACTNDNTPANTNEPASNNNNENPGQTQTNTPVSEGLDLSVSKEPIKDWVTYLTLANEMETFNILYSQNNKELRVLTSCIDGLLSNDNRGNLVPAIAETWGTEDGGKTWTFNLRKGVQWVNMNGEPMQEVKAEDWLVGLEWVLNFYKNEAANTSMPTEMIEGAADYYAYVAGYQDLEIPADADAATKEKLTKNYEDAKAKFEAICEKYDLEPVRLTADEAKSMDLTVFKKMVGIEAPDDYTLIYHCVAELPYFATVATYNCLYPAPQALIGQLGVDGFYACTNENMWYNGCYTITHYINGNEKVLTKNVNNWDAEHIYIERIEQTCNTEAATLAPELFLRGEVDGADIGSDIVADWLSDPEKSQMISSTRVIGDYSYFFGFNFEPKFAAEYEPENWAIAVNNENFRKAVFHGIDRDGYLAAKYPGDDPSIHKINTVTPKGFSVNNGKDYVFYGGLAKYTEGESFDPELAVQFRDAAKAELEAAGCKFPIKVPVNYNTSSTTWANCTVVLEQQLEELLGADFIDIIVVPYSGSGSFLGETRRNGNYALQELNWGADFMDPETWADPFDHKNSYNFFCNETLEQDGINQYTKTEETAALIDQYFELVAAAREETGDMDARYEAFAAAESFYIDHAIVVPGFISGGSYQATRLNGFEGQYAMMGQSSSRYKGQHVYKTAMSQDMFDAQYAEWTAAMEG